MLELMLLVVSCLCNTQNDAVYFIINFAFQERSCFHITSFFQARDFQTRDYTVQTELSLENIWSIWSEVLYHVLTDDHDDKDIHEYSLEYLGIIVLGNHIGNEQSRQLYPKDLVSKTNKSMQTSDILVFFKIFVYFTSSLFESLAVSLDKFHDGLLKNALKVKRTADSCLQFTFDLLFIFVTQIIDKRVLLSKQESIYSHSAIFRFFDAAVSATSSCIFFPGETRLQAIHNELERLEMLTKSYYNADGIILDDDTGLELCLLETSGPFGLIDVSRETIDHVKAAYGLLSMLHTIAHRFVHADIQIYQKLNVCFVHASQDRIRLWTFRLTDKELYVLNRVDSAIVPTSNSDDFKTEYMHLANLFWKLKILLDDAKSVLKKIKESHAENEKAYSDGRIDNLPRLDSYLLENTEVKLFSRILEVSDLHVSSSPIQPDSP